MTRPNFKDFSTPALRERFAREGIKPFRAEQVAQWLYVRGVEDPLQMSDLDRSLRSRLAEEWSSKALALEEVQRSVDGTLKGVLRTGDGALVEAVVIPEGDRRTLCISSQVGCPMACSFCATGAMGFTRNLTTAEIVDQFLHMRAQMAEGEQIGNVVFMGMGEPLLNLPNVIEAVRIFLDQKTFAIASKRITVSTSGVLPRIGRLMESVPVNLALSLHATTDAVRDELVPLNKHFPVADLMKFLRESPLITKRRPVFFEYTLIAGVNDSVADARRLVAMLRKLPAKLNVIPVNPYPGSKYSIPSQAVVEGFMAELAKGNFPIMLRKSRGSDIDAACGQLAARKREETREEPLKLLQ